MRSLGIQGAVRCKPAKTTVSDKAAPCPADRVNRQFQAPHPNLLWLSDFTYVSTWQDTAGRGRSCLLRRPGDQAYRGVGLKPTGLRQTRWGGCPHPAAS